MATRTVASRKMSKNGTSAKTSAPPPGATSGPAQRHVLVRMYNVGFGDCFLIEFPTRKGSARRVLIDCGSIAAASMSMGDLVERIVQDVTDPDGKARIDVVVCTHRHADHVSGFADAAWRDVEVREVWFPWTEDPEDAEARRVRDKQSSLAAALASHWKSKFAATNDPEHSGWLELAMNALSNDKAITMLHQGIRSKPKKKFLWSDGSPTKVDSKVLSDVTAYVLGPSKSRDVIRDMDPPAGETYLRQFGGVSVADGAFEPFGDDWPIDPELYQWTEHSVPLDDRERMRQASSQWDPALTVALEKAVNGTSLVLAFEIEDAVLFFPGDAQWGTWDAMLSNAKSSELLARAKFWKVGHHGSHNATPVDFVKDTVLPTCCAMMSTKTGKWQSIPRRPLLDAIKEKGIELARSDEAPAVPLGRFNRSGNAFVETRIPL